MRLEVIVATINMDERTLHKSMRIRTDALICNQHSQESFQQFIEDGNTIRYLTTTDRGAGANRNLGLLRATGDILLFADDDVVYHEGYEDLVLNAFRLLPDADVVFFNIQRDSDPFEGSGTAQTTRIRKHNAFRFGTVRIAMKRAAQRRHGIWFPLEFGPGSKYPGGEDSLFISSCLKHKLVMYAVPVEIGRLQHRESTWFHGFTKKYFLGKGALYGALFNRWHLLYSVYYLLRHPAHCKETGFLQALRMMRQGASEYLKGTSQANDK